MYIKYNTVLRSRTHDPMIAKMAKDLTKGNLYVTTMCVLASLPCLPLLLSPTLQPITGKSKRMLPPTAEAAALHPAFVAVMLSTRA